MIFVSGTFSHDQLGRLITAAVDRPITTDPGGQKSISAPVEISAARGHEVYKGKLNVWAAPAGKNNTSMMQGDGRRNSWNGRAETHWHGSNGESAKPFDKVSARTGWCVLRGTFTLRTRHGQLTTQLCPTPKR